MHHSGDFRLGCIAIRIYEGTVVFGMLGDEVDEGLKTGSAPTNDLDLFRGFEQGLHFAQFCVELYDVDLLYTVFEETVDGRVEILEVIV